jgi:outer membrane receptor protein involved in Fe transport
MSINNPVRVTVRRALLVMAAASATGLGAGPALAQEAATSAAELEEVVVTGSRIVRQDYVANSPLTTVSEEALKQQADVTLDTFLNTLPQVSPAGSTASNNPPNAGQSNVDLRGLGANRNLVLVDGRRPMVSASDQTVDLNTIPQALIESIEIITGGAGAAYGADAIAGVVNIKTKRNFEGIDVRATYSNATEEWDSQDYGVAVTLGGNFAEGRGNAVVAFDYANREELVKGQREFAAVATSTTTAIPEGIYRQSTNGPSQAAVDALFARYNAMGPVLAAEGLGFNADGTLFSIGSFNTPRDALNYRYPIDLNVNTRFYPDFYSYNFDAINLLILPLERRSILGKVNFEFGNSVEAFAQFGWTDYESVTALAPTPVPSGQFKNPGNTGVTPRDTITSLIVAGMQASTGYIVPVTNPFVPADLRTLLASRTGDNTSLVGAGATEPFFIGYRTLNAGLRQSVYTNTVIQGLLGFKGDIGEKWRWEAYASQGETEIDRKATGNINNQLFQNALEAADGGRAFCTGGVNPFGRGNLSGDCASKLSVTGQTRNDFKLQVVQGFVSGDVVEMPAGPLSVVLGAEYRGFRYEFDPGALNGPIAGFNTATPATGTNSFEDLFAEALIPLVKDASWAKSLELTVGYRLSDSTYKDLVKKLEGDSSDDAYKLELSWQPLENLRARASYQKSVRAPNFGELFDGGSTFPQFFDPCQIGSDARKGTASQNAAQLRALCIATGLTTANADTFVPLPGGQLGLEYAGNTNLDPEEGETVTFGVVLTSPWEGAFEGLRASIDYWQIKLDGPIQEENVNLLLSDCYNYYGQNPTYDVNRFSCQAIRTVRAGTGGSLNNNFISDPRNPSSGVFANLNGESIETSGIDVAIDYALNVGPGKLFANLNLGYLIDYKAQDRSYLADIDYAGTIAFFGEGQSSGGGGSAPEWKGYLTLGYKFGAFGFDARGRYIDSMENRASVIWPGETSFKGVGSVTYWDFGANWNITEGTSLRIGVNNAFDKQPPTYAPNQQSGTDPSLYDVVGRRVFGQVIMKF